MCPCHVVKLIHTPSTWGLVSLCGEKEARLGESAVAMGLHINSSCGELRLRSLDLSSIVEALVA